MDAYDCIRTKLDVRDFQPDKNVLADVKLQILESARLTGSAMNSQHWRFILVQKREHLKTLAEDSTTGDWVKNANFAVVVLTEEKQGFQLIDAGRVLQDMQLTAWNNGVVSCIFTGFNQTAIRRDFAIPNNLKASVAIGFGYSARKFTGRRKNRKRLTELVSVETYGKPFEKP